MFVERPIRKHWNKEGETCIFIAREAGRDSSASDVEELEKVNGANGSLSLSVVSCVKGIINSSCYCPKCSALTPSRGAGDRKSCIPIKENGVKNFGWNGPRLTPAKSILTPTPVLKTRSKSKTKTKPSEAENSKALKSLVNAACPSERQAAKSKIPKVELTSKSQLMTPKRSAFSPQYASKWAFNTPTKSFSSSKVDNHVANNTSDDLGHDSKTLTSFEYEDSEPECFQHEIRARLASDSPASIKGFNKEDRRVKTWSAGKKLNGQRSESEHMINTQSDVNTLQKGKAKPKEVFHKKLVKTPPDKAKPSKRAQSYLTTSSEDICILDDKDRNLDLAEIENLDDEKYKKILEKADDINESLDGIENPNNYQHSGKSGYIDTCDLELVDVAGQGDQQNSQLSKVDISSFSEVDDSGHVTCVISSPPSTCRKEIKIPAKNSDEAKQKTGCTGHKSSKLPVFNKRSLPKTPSEVRTVRYGQKLVQKNQAAVTKTGKVEKAFDRNNDKYVCEEGLSGRESHTVKGLYCCINPCHAEYFYVQHSSPIFILFQPRKTHPHITENC